MRAQKTEKEISWQMFDRISATYDLLNHGLSFGLDGLWRQKVVRHIPMKNKIKLIDIATGSGDLIIKLAEDKRVQEAYGTDLSLRMLSLCKKKVKKKGLEKKIYLKRCDAQKMPFQKEQFDMASVAFGIRNVPNPLKALRETHRILKKKGVFIVLELTVPANIIIRSLYILYFRFVLPVIGGLVSGSLSAYRYLNKTVEAFPQGRDFCELLTKSGFKEVGYDTYTMGIVTLYHARKV